MAILVNSGRAAMAAALKLRSFHFAWGRGETWWNSSGESTRVFAGSPQVIALAHAPVVALTLKSADGTVIYDETADYIWNSATGVITRVPSGAIPAGGTVKVEYAYGRPDVPSAATALVDEVGRRVANSVQHVVPDPAGLLETADGNKWTVSPIATRYLYLSVLFQFSEAVSDTIREMGIFMDTAAAAGIPPGQQYLRPVEIADIGTLVLLDRLNPIIRSPSTRQGFSFVITI
jgi:hypothetical protein